MFQTFLQAMGGLGLFLLGMVVMTDGLKGLAGDMLRNTLTRFTRSPTSGAVTGAMTTAILQSSSATTVAAVGFVSAGLLTFPQSLGIIFGANLGTTVTGWLVALLGFKYKLGAVVMPLILIGVLMRLFMRGKWAALGLAMAGFSLIFVGITVMQTVMADVQGVITPADFPPDTVIGRLQLVAIGIAITLITQSSSAGVATALAAVHTDTISFAQAAAMVIGMDVATTIKAALASMGGSVETRRTGYSHVVYNVFTAIVALLILTPYTWLWGLFGPNAIADNTEIALVAFHSSFNILGIALILPLAHRFAHLIQRLVPEKQTALSRRLDPTLLAHPTAALDAVRATLMEEIMTLFSYVQNLLMRKTGDDRELVGELQRQLDATHCYIDLIHLTPDEGGAWQTLMAGIHVLDHLQRLHERCDEDIGRLQAAQADEYLRSNCERLAHDLSRIIQAIDSGNWEKALLASQQSAGYFQDEASPMRETIMKNVASGKTTVPLGTDQLEAIRWLRRVSRHVQRIVFHVKTLAEH